MKTEKIKTKKTMKTETIKIKQKKNGGLVIKIGKELSSKIKIVTKKNGDILLKKIVEKKEKGNPYSFSNIELPDITFRRTHIDTEKE